MYSVIKVLFDKIMSAALLLTLAPVLLSIYCGIFLNYRFNPIYSVVRSGKNQKPFRYYKFQSMYPVGHKAAKTSSDFDRITPLGFFIRKYSVDELPSLLCVLRGDMSLVGPRPLPPVYDDLYSKPQRQRFLVKPGVTGLAQIRGRNSISWKRKFALDYYYVKKNSFCFDIYIVLGTIGRVVAAKDVHPSGASVVDNFNGSN